MSGLIPRSTSDVCGRMVVQGILMAHRARRALVVSDIIFVPWIACAPAEASSAASLGPASAGVDDPASDRSAVAGVTSAMQSEGRDSGDMPGGNTDGVSGGWKCPGSRT